MKKRTLKKLSVLLGLSMLMTFSLIGCGNREKVQEQSEVEETTEEKEVVEVEPEEEPETVEESEVSADEAAAPEDSDEDPRLTEGLEKIDKLMQLYQANAGDEEMDKIKYLSETFEEKDSFDNYVTMDGVSGKDVAYFSYLLYYFADVNNTDFKADSPLEMAAQLEWENLAKFFLGGDWTTDQEISFTPQYSTTLVNALLVMNTMSEEEFTGCALGEDSAAFNNQFPSAYSIIMEAASGNAYCAFFDAEGNLLDIWPSDETRANLKGSFGNTIPL